MFITHNSVIDVVCSSVTDILCISVCLVLCLENVSTFFWCFTSDGREKSRCVCVCVPLLCPLCKKKSINKGRGRSLLGFFVAPRAVNLVTRVFHQLPSSERAAEPGDSRSSKSQNTHTFAWASYFFSGKMFRGTN